MLRQTHQEKYSRIRFPSQLVDQETVVARAGKGHRREGKDHQPLVPNPFHLEDS